jgi:hypothetical protein
VMGSDGSSREALQLRDFRAEFWLSPAPIKENLRSSLGSVLVMPRGQSRIQHLDRRSSCRAFVVSKRAMTEARAFSGFGWKPPQGRRAARRLTIFLGSSRSFGDREPPIGAAAQGATSWTEANPRRKARCVDTRTVSRPEVRRTKGPKRGRDRVLREEASAPSS